MYPPNRDLLAILNNNQELDFQISFNNFYNGNDGGFDNPYLQTKINSKFYDSDSLANTPDKSNPLFLSMNIQSLQSKFSEFKNFIQQLSSSGINVDVIALQELWTVNYPDLLTIPGYQKLMFKTRNNMRGGGVGFYVRNGLHASIIEDKSPFENKIIETLTIKVNYPNKEILLSSMYRSNGIHPNLSQKNQMDHFFLQLDTLLSKLADTKLDSYVLADSNINLLAMNQQATDYLDLMFSRGFLQTINKAY